MTSIKRTLVCAAALVLALGATVLCGCAEKPHTISYNGTSTTSVQATAEDIAGVWVVDASNSFNGSSYGINCYLMLEQDGTAVMFRTEPLKVREGTWS